MRNLPPDYTVLRFDPAIRMQAFVPTGGVPLVAMVRLRTPPVQHAQYVDPDVRRGGYGRALLTEAERWARLRGYQGLASDSQLDNHLAHAAHRRAGFQEVDRVVQFRKAIAGPGD